jgi:hypothetical protein
MKTFRQIIEGFIGPDVLHSHLTKLGKHTDQGGGYHLYKPHKSMTPKDVAKTLVGHGFERNTHTRHGAKTGPDVHSYSRTPAPYHTETVNIDHKDGKVTWIHRSLQRG